jgi:murein peptide amidase A
MAASRPVVPRNRYRARIRGLCLLPAASAALLLAAAGPAPAATRHETLGTSVQGRAIQAIETGDPDGSLKVVIVGCIHGNEPAGIGIADDLTALRPAPGVDLWVIPDMNPDGVAANTRRNAHNVDLNRNFPWNWLKPSKKLDRYSGKHALSEPESRDVYRFLLKVKPQLVIWFHQPYDVVDESGGSVALEQLFSSLTGEPLTELPRYPGSVAEWVDHRFPGSTSFVVELPPGLLSAAQTKRYALAVETLARFDELATARAGSRA